MEKYLNGYIGRIQPVFGRIPEKAAHTIAAAFFAYKFELYPKAIRECATATGLLGDGEGMRTAKTALRIISAYAEALENSQVKPEKAERFIPEDYPNLAVNLYGDSAQDPETLDIDNALILVYAIAVIASPDDEQALEEHRNYILTIIEIYKKALGIQ
ncbi:MAG: hypothetical protein PHD55_05070 [Methanoregula sp.]|nr:hypothetical protein [Methanoregula sp.]